MITELPQCIGRLLVTPGVLERSRELLDPFRTLRVEGCLLWYGFVLDSQSCLVTTCVCPTQKSDATTYDIPAESMRDVRRAVRPHGLLLLVQIHSHPTRAFFSVEDEEHALNSRPGALNMIVPDYGNARWIEQNRFCIVERNETGQWERWSSKDWNRLIIVPDALPFALRS
ncbi:Mov34/MPN/PAD-1 family protein [Bradyrhizobium sp. URHD0069]|uniref:Mov34/MPN/PAD-1 family protein n=1 Tax=Bradyrhizobium sp. URHD0069 TaxID=1380355 RepID=UPI00055BBF7E